MSKAGMAILAAWVMGAMAAVAGIAAMSIPVLQSAGQAAPPAGALPVRGSQPLVPPAKLRLSGEVTPLAAGDALQSVEVRVGTELIPVSVQGQYFEATLFLMDTARMASIEVRSTKGRQASLLGSVSRLAALGGGDGRLDVQEHAALRVSPFTTALLRHIEYALGRQPLNDAELDQTTRAVGHDGLGALSYALSKIAGGELPLPAGYQDGYAFSADREAFHDWPHLPAHEMWSAYLFNQAPGSRVADVAELPARMLMLGGLSVTEYPSYSGATRLLERLSDGSVNFHEDQPLATPNYAIRVDESGQIVLTPRTAVVRLYERTSPDNDVMQRTSQGHVLRRLMLAGGISVWALRSDWLEVAASSPQSPPVPVTEYRVLSATDLDAWKRADAWRFTSLQFSLPWLCIEPGQMLTGRLAVCGHPLHRFDFEGLGFTFEHDTPLSADGEPMVPTRSTQFEVSIQNPSLLTINNGQTETHFWRLQSGTVGRAVVPSVFLSRSLHGDTRGETLVGLTPSFLYQFEYDPPSIIQPLGNWRNGYQKAQPPSYVGLDVSVAFSRLADGSSAYSVQGDNGNSVENHRWSMAGFGIYNIRASARYPDGSSRQVGACTSSVIAAGATACNAVIRYFRPITLARGSYYGVEERYRVSYPDPDAPDGQQNRFSIVRDYSRLGFETCESSECASVFPKTVSQAPAMPGPGVQVFPQRGTRLGGRPRAAVRWIPWLTPLRSTSIEERKRDESCPSCDRPRADLWAVVRGTSAPVSEPDDSKEADLLHGTPTQEGGGKASHSTEAGAPAPAEAHAHVDLTSSAP